MKKRQAQARSDSDYTPKILKLDTRRTFKNAIELMELINEYFRDIADRHAPSSIEGLVSHIGCHRDTIHLYDTGQYDDKVDITHDPVSGTVLPRMSDVIKKAKSIILADQTENAMEGRSHPIFSIFLFKNNHGYTDKLDIDSNTTHTINVVDYAQLPTTEYIDAEAVDKQLSEPIK